MLTTKKGLSQRASGKTTVALYARVSTSDQNIETQLEALRDYCSRMNYEVAGEFVDRGFSGKDDKRPEFEQMLASLRERKFKAVVVYKLDRIGRSLKHLLNLFEEFKNRDIGFISLTQNINTQTAEGRMFLKMLMVLAEYERELIVSRTLDGLARAKKQGKTLGRPRGKRDSRPRAKSGYYLRHQKGKQSSPTVLTSV